LLDLGEPPCGNALEQDVRPSIDESQLDFRGPLRVEHFGDQLAQGLDQRE